MAFREMSRGQLWPKMALSKSERATVVIEERAVGPIFMRNASTIATCIRARCITREQRISMT